VYFKIWTNVLHFYFRLHIVKSSEINVKCEKIKPLQFFMQYTFQAWNAALTLWNQAKSKWSLRKWDQWHTIDIYTLHDNLFIRVEFPLLAFGLINIALVEVIVSNLQLFHCKYIAILYLYIKVSKLVCCHALRTGKNGEDSEESRPWMNMNLD
jgi:hypothetical protein